MTADLHAIRALHGGAVYDGGRRWVGPGPGHSRRDQSLSVRIDGDRVLIHSFAGDPYALCANYLNINRDDGNHPDAARRGQMRAEREMEARATRERNWRFCDGVWASSVEIEGTAAEAYLTRRGVDWPYPASLRFNAAAPLTYDCRRVAPALVALVSSADGQPRGLHVTALLSDGSGKAPGLNARVMFGACRGNAVHLAAPREGVLAVAEGIETALSFGRLKQIPTWAALSTAGLNALELPRGLTLLNIALDGDRAGREAGGDLAKRASKHVDVVTVDPGDGLDWNDVLMQAKHG